MYGNSYVDFKNVKFGTIGSTIQFEDDGITVKKTESSLKVE
jgi:hypothetical protein